MLRYHVKCNSVLWHALSQRECVGALTSLEARKANVQECNGVKSVCDSTEREIERQREKLREELSEKQREMMIRHAYLPDTSNV